MPVNAAVSHAPLTKTKAQPLQLEAIALPSVGRQIFGLSFALVRVAAAGFTAGSATRAADRQCSKHCRNIFPKNCMWPFRCFSLATKGLAFMLPAVALAQQSQDRTWCYEADSTRDQAIAGCTALILSGRESKDHLAVEFFNRAHAYHAKGNYDYAIAD